MIYLNALFFYGNGHYARAAQWTEWHHCFRMGVTRMISKSKKVQQGCTRKYCRCASPIIPVFMVAAMLVASCSNGDSPHDPSEAIDGDMLARAVAKEDQCIQREARGVALLYGRYLAWLSGADLYGVSRAYVNALRTELQCIAEADDCAAVIACTGGDVNDVCDPGVVEQKCNGTRVLGCWERIPATENSFWGQTADCSVDLDGNTMCLQGHCVADTCEGEWARCDGDVVTECRDGLLIRTNCEIMYRECVQDEGDESARCDFHIPCPEGRSHCEGNIYVVCDEESGGPDSAIVVNRADCAKLGTSCVEEEFTDEDQTYILAHCAEPSDCADMATGCNGNQLTFCGASGVVTLDCAILSGGTCGTNYYDGSDSFHCLRKRSATRSERIFPEKL
jgi:hypothetical protein